MRRFARETLAAIDTAGFYRRGVKTTSRADLVSVADAVMPAYEQVADSIEADVLKSKYPAGSKLPSERGLAKYYGVSRYTVSRAVSYLEDKGIIYSKERQGNFVRPFRIEFPLSASLQLGDILCRLRLPLSNKLLYVGSLRAYGSLGSRMGIPTGEPLVIMKRVRRVGQFPLVCDTSYFREGAFPGIEAYLKENRLFARSVLWDEYGIKLCNRLVTLETEPADGELADQLEVQPGSTLFKVEFAAMEPEGSPAVLSIAFFRGDAVRLKMEPPKL